MQNYTRVVDELNVSRWHFTHVSSLSAWCIGSPLYGGVRGGLFLSRYKAYDNFLNYASKLAIIFQRKIKVLVSL